MRWHSIIATLCVLTLPCAGFSQKAAKSSGSKPAPPAADSRAQSLGAVRPSNLVLMQLGISSFAGAEEVGKIVQNDLALADVATRPSNTAAATAAAAADSRSGQVNLDGWVAAGVNYVLRGSVSGNTLQAELYDVASKQRTFGKSYAGYSPAQMRRHAHRVADDVMTAISNSPGIFSSQICYVAPKGSGRKEVVLIDPDGGGARQLTNEQSIVAMPCWGQNGTEVYYTSYRDKNPDLYGTTLSGRRFEISRRPGLNASPAWSERQQRLAASLAKDGNSEIYTMTRDGRDLRRLTNSPDADTAPAWSPDGTQIAFTSDRDGKPQIFVMGSGGGSARRISHGGYCDSSSWSPDGRKIAYVAREGGEFNIYVVDVAGGGPAMQLTRGARDNQDPSWAPDSKHLVFNSNRGGTQELYMMNLDTKRAQQITKGAGAVSPDWGPLLP